MQKILFLVLSSVMSLAAHATLPTDHQGIDYTCRMSCGDIELSKNCKGLEFSGSLNKDENGNWSGFHTHFVFRPNIYEYFRAVPCRADYSAKLTVVDSESFKISFSKAVYQLPQTCADGSRISEGFTGSIRPFSIYLVRQAQKGIRISFKSLASVPSETNAADQSGSPSCQLTFR